MSRETFYCICKKLALNLQREATHRKLPSSVRQKVAIEMYLLASPMPPGCVAELFEVGRSSAGCAGHKVVDAFCATFRHLQENQPDLEEVMERFWTKYDFVMCPGAIGGTHFEVIKSQVTGLSKLSKQASV